MASWVSFVWSSVCWGVGLIPTSEGCPRSPMGYSGAVLTPLGLAAMSVIKYNVLTNATCPMYRREERNK